MSVSEQADFDERRKGTPWRCVIMVKYGVINYRHMTTKKAQQSHVTYDAILRKHAIYNK